MDIRNLDLNLLVIFDAMARTRSVSKAAEAVGLSQPATSAALARLRDTLGDHLFVRVGSQMQPTPRAQQLAPVVRRLVDAVNHEVLQVATFDTSAARRRFTILTPDIGEVACLPGVWRRTGPWGPSPIWRRRGFTNNGCSKRRTPASLARGTPVCQPNPPCGSTWVPGTWWCCPMGGSTCWT